MSGKLKDMDAWEETIRQNADYYATIAFQPRVGQIPLMTFDSLEQAIAYAEITMGQENRYRCVSIYAVDKERHHAMCGSVNQYQGKYKKVIPKKKK